MHTILSIEEAGERSRGRGRDSDSPRPQRGKVRVTTEDEESFVISSLKAARLGLEQGAGIPEETYTEIMDTLRKDCMLKCGTLLGGRDYSEQRLREKLREAGYPAFICEEAMDKLRKAGYLNDLRFAQSYIRTHIQDRSRLRIIRDLTGKGIPEREIEEAFATVAAEEDLEEAQRQQVLRLLKKRGFDPSQAGFEERQKTMAFLHRRGYPTDLIRRLTGQSDDF